MNQRAGVLGKASYVGSVILVVAGIGVVAVRREFTIAPLVLSLSAIPVVGLFVAKRPLISATPDLIFGAIDTGLLVIPALWGGITFGVAGAIAGGVIGDALTDAIAGFFEGGIAERLRARGIEESREPITSGLGKMAGCLLGSGLVLCLAMLVGVQPEFN